MNKFWLVYFVAVVLMNSPAWADDLLVSAAASLTDALSDIGKSYESKSHHRVSYNFGASSQLARQIKEGSPVDLFFSADLEKMENLEKKGFIEHATRKNLLSNKLVMVVPEDPTVPIRSPRDLLRDDVQRIAVAESSSVPVGIYTRQYLEGKGIWSGVKNKVIPVANARAALASVESGNVDVGFVYETDAAISRKVTVVHRIPRDMGPKIVYSVGLLRESNKKKAALHLLKFFSSRESKRTFAKYGFIVLDN